MKTSAIVALVVAGVAFLIAGLVVVRRQLASARGLEKPIVCGPTFVASALATFGMEHLVSPRALMTIVPVWMPWRLFWVYFVAAALFAAALSYVARRCMRPAAFWLAAMFWIFVLLTTVPGLVKHPDNRLFWVLACRETTFGMGAFAFGGMLAGLAWPRTIARIVVGIVLGFYGVIHFLQLSHVPGVPLEKVTPAWIPAPYVWSGICGVILLAASVSLLLNQRARMMTAIAGTAATALTVFFYLPIFVVDPPALRLEGVNYIWDTLLFAGTLLMLAAAMPAYAGRSRTTA
jgi:uncharacterized membrane protein